MSNGYHPPHLPRGQGQPHHGPQPVPTNYAHPSFGGAAPPTVFSDVDREKLVRAGKGANAMSILVLIRAAFFLLNARLLAAVAHGTFGAFGLSGGQRLTEMGTRRQSDIDNLMRAYDGLSNMFLTRIIWVAFWVVLFAVIALSMLAVIGVAGMAAIFEEALREVT